MIGETEINEFWEDPGVKEALRCLTEAMPSRTRIQMNIDIKRGQAEVRTDVTYKIAEAAYASLVVDEPITDTIWNQILALDAFSENPNRRHDSRLRNVLLGMRENGYVEQTQGARHQAPINDILESADLLVRMTSSRVNIEGHQYPVQVLQLRKIF